MKAKLGSGERFKKLASKVEANYEKKGMSESKAKQVGKAVAAKVGMEKYGKAKMEKMAHKKK